MTLNALEVAAIQRGEFRPVFIKRSEIVRIFREYKSDGADVPKAADAFERATSAGLTDNQKNAYNAMEALLQGQANHWPSKSSSRNGSKATRVSVRLMIYAARTSDDPGVVFNAGKVLAQAAHRREPCIPLRFHKWAWQYLGDAPIPGTKWGWTGPGGDPIDRIEAQPWITNVHALLPVNGREMDAAIKRELKFVLRPEYPELYMVMPERLAEMYIEHRK